MRNMRQRVDNPRIVWAALKGLFDHQTPSSGAAFKRSRHPNQIRWHIFQDSPRLALVTIYFSPFLLFSPPRFSRQKKRVKQPFNLLIF